MRKLFLLLFGLMIAALPPSVYAAVAILNAAETANPTACGGAGTCDLTNMTLSAGSNRKVICGVSAEDNATDYNVNGVTFGGVAMSPAVQGQSPTDQNIGELWYLDETSLPPPGDHTGAVDFTEDVTIVSITCWVVSGIASGAPKATDKIESDTAFSGELTLAVDPTDAVFVLATESNGAGTWTHEAGQNELTDTDFGSATTGISWELGEGSPFSQNTIGVGVRFVMVGAAWAEAAAAPSTNILFRRRAQ